MVQTHWLGCMVHVLWLQVGLGSWNEVDEKRLKRVERMMAKVVLCAFFGKGLRSWL